MRSWFKFLFLSAVLLPLMGVLVYNLPPVRERLEWRVSSWRAQIKYRLDPPEQALFVPQERAQIALMVSATLSALTPLNPQPSATPTPEPTKPGATPSLTPLPSPTLTPTPIPESVFLSGIVHEYEKWNNCGPATLGMQLSFWGWQGDQRVTAAFLKPNTRDKNVGPLELAAYVREETGLEALVRVGGDLELLKKLIAAGFPVIVEKTLELPGLDGWVGHYGLVSGYDEAGARFITQDSYIMADFPVPYDHMSAQWWSFNNTYVVAFPPERAAELMAVLGPHADERLNDQLAAQSARAEIARMSGRDLFFAWFNLGSSLVGLEDYTGASQAFDRAFDLYASLDPEIRPWRIMWYRFAPYLAYYHTGRYQDVIDLASTTLGAAGEPVLEESWYWRARSREALGELDGAVADYRKAVEMNEHFSPAWEALERLGAAGG